MEFGQAGRIHAMLGMDLMSVFAPAQFMRLPPGIKGPMRHRYFEGELVEGASSKINGFRDEFLQSASALAGSENTSPSLPGSHPYVRGDRLESLRSQNQILEKENMELKKQLDDVQKNSPKTTRT